jgi:hypothetical protein
MAKTKKIKIVDVLVNTENYRFETVSSQKEAIDKMLEDQNENLYNLAENIIKNGLNPNDKIQTVLSNHDQKKYIVLEGNRRAVTIKLINNPDLIEGSRFAGLKKKFKKLHEKNKDRIPVDIECVVYDDAKEADTWIGIKHGYGITGTGTQGWDPLQKQRFGEKTEGKTSTAMQIIKLLKSSGDVSAEIKSGLENINTTNLDRLIDDPDVRKFLGVEINGGVLQSTIPQKEVVKGMSQIVKDILSPGFKVKKIYSKEDRRDYISKFQKSSIPDVSLKGKPWQFTAGIPTPAKAVVKSKSKSNATGRRKLIPKSCDISITNPKVNNIFHELKDLDLKYKNAVAVLFRVFVELSLDSYIEGNNLTTTPSASTNKMDLLQKVNFVANHLEQKKFADAAICKGIKSAIKDKNDLLGIDTWHAYVHNNKFSPKETNLIITWDNMQDFMIILWNNIK